MNSILVIEDDKLTREWLCKLVADAFEDCNVTSVSNVANACQILAEGHIQLCLIDMRLPDGTGLDVLEFIHQKELDVTPVIATIYSDDEHIFAAISAGAVGYILKDDPADSIVANLRAINNGGLPVSASVARRIFSFFQKGTLRSDSKQGAISEAYALTEREIDVLQLVSKGLQRGEVAQYLEISPHTVAGYIKSIYKKLNVCSRAEAAVIAKDYGVI